MFAIPVPWLIKKTAIEPDVQWPFLPSYGRDSLVSLNPEVALRCAAGPGAGYRSIVGNDIRHLAVEHEVIHSSGFVLCVCFEVNSPLRRIKCRYFDLNRRGAGVDKACGCL